jgi:hypothetical protein
MRLAEIHSSELTSSCMRKTYHRLRGEITGETTTALYRGLVAGRVMELMHECRFQTDPSELTVEAAADVQKTLLEENRVLSESVENNRGDILGEITEVAHLYIDRLGSTFNQAKLIGCELPCRVTLPFGEFASHMDLVIRDTNNAFGFGEDRLIVFDWKWREEIPSPQYLARNMQFALYYLMAKRGAIRMTKNLNDLDWIEFGEEAVLGWIHLPNFRPYKRRTITKDDQGEEKEYVKGDLRPNRAIFKFVVYEHSQEKQIVEELAMRKKMLENDLFPLNPEPVSCRICDAEAFCNRFDMPQS